MNEENMTTFEKEINTMATTITNITSSNAEESPIGSKIATILGAAKTPEAAQVLKMAIDNELAEQKASMGIITESENNAETTIIPIADEVTDEQLETQDNTATENKKVVTIDDENSGFEHITETFDEYLERHKDDKGLDEIEIKENTAASIIKDQYSDISFEDARLLASILKQWKDKKISSLEAYNKFPNFMTIDFNNRLLKAGVPFKEQNNHKKEFAKSVLEDLAESTQMQQATDDMNYQIEQIYSKYGDDVNVLYQAGIYEKINLMKKVAKSIDNEQYTEEIAEKSKMSQFEWEDSKKRKVEDVNLIVEALYESFKFEKFAKRIGHIKAKKIDLTDTKRCFSNFKSKYTNSKFNIADVSIIIPILEKHCDFSHEQAVEFAVVFCEYCKNMRPSKIHEHVFMYYTISNINSLSIKVRDKAAKFSNFLIDNLKALNAIHEAKGDGSDYIAKELSEDDINELIKSSSDITNETSQETEDNQ